MESAKWKAAAAIVVALAAGGTASSAAQVRRQAWRPQIIRQQGTPPRAADLKPLPAPLTVSPPKYVPSTYSSASLHNPLWLSPTQLINPEGQRVSVIDTLTGHETPLDDINAVIDEREKANAGHSEMPFSSSTLRLSPDGRWLLWPSGTREHPAWQAMTLEGAERREWTSPTQYGGEGVAAWMRDSTHWVELEERISQGHQQDYVRVYSVDTPEVHEFPLKRTPRPLEFLPSGQFIFTTDGHAWMIDNGVSLGTEPGVLVSNVEYHELLPGPDMWTLRHTTLRMQTARSQASSDEFALSPDGRWLVWRDNSDHAGKRTRLILSRPDGSTPQTLFETTKTLSYPHWTPDGQRIVFHWDGYGLISNGPNGEGMYAISLGPLAARSSPPAGLGVSRAGASGPFPVTSGQPWPALVKGNGNR